MVTHPLPFTLPVDTMKVRSNYQDEQERRVFLSTPSQHETARMDRPIFESLTEALQLRWVQNRLAHASSEDIATP